MRLGLDLDGCVYDFPAALRDWLGRPELPEPTCWDLGEAWELPGWRVEFREAVRDGLFAEGEPYPEALTALDRLTVLGWEFHVVTHRNELAARALTDTADWLRRWRVPYTGITFTARKSTVACDAYVDDSVDVAVELARTGRRVFLLDRPWNREPEEPPLGIVRASWGEVVDALAPLG